MIKDIKRVIISENNTTGQISATELEVLITFMNNQKIIDNAMEKDIALEDFREVFKEKYLLNNETKKATKEEKLDFMMIEARAYCEPVILVVSEMIAKDKQNNKGGHTITLEEAQGLVTGEKICLVVSDKDSNKKAEIHDRPKNEDDLESLEEYIPKHKDRIEPTRDFYNQHFLERLLATKKLLYKYLLH